MTDLSISVVSYNTRQQLKESLDSVFANARGIDFEVIVVDNASQDSSPEMVRSKFPQVRLIANDENRFFACAHNQALAMAQGRHVLILNSDTVIPQGTLSELVKFLDLHPGVGAVGCQEINSEGQTQHTGSGFRTPWIEAIDWTVLRDVYRLRRHLQDLRLPDWDRQSSRSVDVLTDCFLMVRRDVLEALNGYDERFLLYYTEDDLCLRIWELGKQIFFNAEVYYVHRGQQSTRQEGQRRVRSIYFQDMRTYYEKHFGWLQAQSMWGLIRTLHRLGLGRYIEI